MLANMCVESQLRELIEQGFEVAVVKDATADYSDVEMHAALEVNLPHYANAIVTTSEAVESISALDTPGKEPGGRPEQAPLAPGPPLERRGLLQGNRRPAPVRRPLGLGGRRPLPLLRRLR